MTLVETSGEEPAGYAVGWAPSHLKTGDLVTPKERFDVPSRIGVDSVVISRTPDNLGFRLLTYDGFSTIVYPTVDMDQYDVCDTFVERYLAWPGRAN